MFLTFQKFGCLQPRGKPSKTEHILAVFSSYFKAYGIRLRIISIFTDYDRKDQKKPISISTHSVRCSCYRSLKQILEFDNYGSLASFPSKYSFQIFQPSPIWFSKSVPLDICLQMTSEVLRIINYMTMARKVLTF